MHASTHLMEMVLMTKNTDIDEVNNAILKSLSEELHTYLNANSLIPTKEGASVAARVSMDSLYPVGVPVILLRNLDTSSGLCNGTRLIVRRLARRLIVAEIVGGSHAGTILNIPRITTSSTGNHWPFTLLRRQFPVQLAFAMTINKAQGQTMGTVGIYLPEPVFTHGQLYVALSRATSVDNVSMHCPNEESTTNVVYTELLR
ncbi:hypothetical protein CY35_17G063900 [Sphagnum magellanicum]|nr:hypothetical protein CY35_17G063900 [Sphagnum magellanicum]